jgi:hypothetical protein
MSKNSLARIVATVALVLSLGACQDTKTRVENEQLKAHILQLQKDSGELGNRVDVLTKENADLKAQIELVKNRHPAKKTSKSKTRRRTSRRRSSSQN